MKLDRRRFGILMPVFSLAGTGTMDSAGAFLDFLSDCGAGIWQVLPLGPTHEDGSPYLALSAHAGNPALIGIRELSRRLDAPVSSLDDAWQHVGRDDMGSRAFNEFAANNGHWLPDFALFCAVRQHLDNAAWYTWPADLRRRDPAAIASARTRLATDIDRFSWQQFVFFQQWSAIREACRNRGIGLLGDVPIYVSHDSADVWQHQALFQLADDGTANVVAGVPPDYFSPTGQRWGNPLYNWERLEASGFKWWIDRMATQAHLFDIVRIDHFRGLESYWEIPSDAATAEIGQWRKGPGAGLLATLTRALPALSLVAEDLGIITADVDALRRQFDLPGIRVLQFGFDGVWDNPHSPDNIEENCVLYTGTHDNDTSHGWYRSLPDWQREIVDQRLAKYPGPFPASLIACAFESPARTVIIPLQDLLSLGSECRTNTPGTMVDNWQWRLGPGDSLAEASAMIAGLGSSYARQAGSI